MSSMAEHVSSGQILRQPSNIVKAAAISDFHNGNEDPRYLKLDQLDAEIKILNGLGIDILFVVGDLTQSGTLAEASEVGKVLTNFNGELVVGTGNHDHISKLGATERGLRRQGIETMDRKSLVKNINGVKLGIIVEDGSIPQGHLQKIEGLHWKDRTPEFHKVTGGKPLRRLQRNTEKLLSSGIDALIVARHIPVFLEQYGDGNEHTIYYQSHPDFANYLLSLPTEVLQMVLSGHYHSFESDDWGRRNPWAEVGENKYAANVAQPNATRAGRDPFTLFTIEKLMTESGEKVIFQPVTTDMLVDMNAA